MYLQNLISRTTQKKIVFCKRLEGQWRKQQDLDPNLDPDPDPFVRGMDPRIRHQNVMDSETLIRTLTSSAGTGNFSFFFFKKPVIHMSESFFLDNQETETNFQISCSTSLGGKYKEKCALRNVKLDWEKFNKGKFWRQN